MYGRTVGRSANRCPDLRVFLSCRVVDYPYVFLGVRAMLGCMSNKTLADAVRTARLTLGWGKEEAARQAGVSSATWKRVEDGLPVQDHKLTAMARALGWTEGHAFRLKGGIATDEVAEVEEDDLDAVLAALEAARAKLEALKRERT